MATVTIGAVNYPVYGSVSTDDPGTPDPPGVLSADSYLAAKVGATSWATATTLLKQQALVTATRTLDTMRWVGEKTVAAQPLQWPRTGVTRDDGSAVDSTVYPIEIVYGAYELAYLLSRNPNALSRLTGGQGNVKRVKAGSAEVEFWGQSGQPILPQEVLDLVADFLASRTSLLGSIAISYGTGAESAFDDDDYYRIDY